MIKFDERLTPIKHYLLSVYYELASKFYQSCKDHPEVEGHTFGELENICPEAYEAFQKVKDFLEYTEKFLGYKLDEESNCFKYIQ